METPTRPRRRRPLPGGGAYKLPALRSLREESGVSKAELTRRSGVSRYALWYLENGERLARAGTVKRLADGLGVEPMDLVLPRGDET